MATVGEAIAATLIAQWNVGTGGTKPDPIQYLVERPERDPNPTVADAIYVWLPLRRTFDPIDVAEVYRNVTYTLRIVCHTKTSSARQLEIENEVDRILNSGTVITGATRQRVKEINDISNRSYSNLPKYISEVIMEVFTAMEVSATAYGTATATTLTTDELIVNTSFAGAAVLDEDDMASDSATKISTQQSIKAYIDAANMIGAANAAWVPCQLMGGPLQAYWETQKVGYVANLGADDLDMIYSCPLPTTRGGLKLYVAGTRVGLGDADATDYVDNTYVYGITGTSQTQIDVVTTNRNTAAVHEDIFAAVDASSYERVVVWLECVNASLNQLDIYSVLLKCYYA